MALTVAAAGVSPGAAIQPVTSLVAQAVPATVEGTRLYGDAYLVVDGAKIYSVLDVYIKASQSTDIVASVYGVSAYKASWVQDQSKAFKHAGGSSWNPNYTAAAGAAWDSFVTAGLRTQSNDGDGGTLTALTADPGFSNMNSANASRITGASTGNGPGWYPSVGATAATNPHCVVGFYNGATNLAKTDRNITANGINAGDSLDNMFMIARLAIDTADIGAGVTPTVTIRLCMTVLNTGASSYTGGGSNVAYRAQSTLEFSNQFGNDSDQDGVADFRDNCITVPNPSQADCDADGTGDACEGAPDCNANGIPDACDISSGVATDCNANGIPDACDIGSGLSRDGDQDGRPDECEPDCNKNAMPDDFDLAIGTSDDCNGNGIPDECEDGTIASSTGTLGRFGNGVIASGVLPDMVTSITPVTVTVRARGDLNNTTELARVRLAGVQVASLFTTGGRDCPPDFDEESFTLAPETWNELVANSPDGDMLVQIDGSGLVDANQCADGFAQLSVLYRSSRFDCNGDGLSDLCQIASGQLLDCNNNGVADPCDLASAASADVDGNGVPDECQPDCNGNDLPDSWEIATGRALDCNGNGIPDACDLSSGTSQDLDGNAVPDECQPDCNGNLKPDPWELATGQASDCNANGQPDDCDIAAGWADIDGNGVPDRCEPDCNGNSLPDGWEISTGRVADCNGNGVPESCEVIDGQVADCDLNGVPDSCDIASGRLDEDQDGRIDACEFARGDFDLDGEISSADVSILLLIFGERNPPFGDLDGDGEISSADISILLVNFGLVADGR